MRKVRDAVVASKHWGLKVLKQPCTSLGTSHKVRKTNTRRLNFDFAAIGGSHQLIYSDVIDLIDYVHCLKITQNVAFELLNFGIFHQFLSH